MQNLMNVSDGDPFTMIPNETLNDSSLSWKAKGLLAYLVSKPPRWKFYCYDIENHSKDGKESIRSGLKELRKHGYAKLVRYVKDGRTVEWRLHISKTPKFKKTTTQEVVFIPTKRPDPDFPDQENTDHLVIKKESNTDSGSFAGAKRSVHLDRFRKKTKNGDRFKQRRCAKPKEREFKEFCVKNDISEESSAAFLGERERLKDWTKNWKNRILGFNEKFERDREGELR